MVQAVFGFLSPEVMAISIPIISIMGGIAIAIVAIFVEGHKKELRHKERLAAMEKGIPIPEEPKNERRPAHLRNRTGGLVMTLLGLALTIALFTVSGPDGGVWGLLPMAIGLGLLFSSHLERKETERSNGS